MNWGRWCGFMDTYPPRSNNARTATSDKVMSLFIALTFFGRDS
jgi:hypothetical protein